MDLEGDGYIWSDAFIWSDSLTEVMSTNVCVPQE